MKGIMLAGGSGTRLYPITISVTKQLLPVYNKPLIYYPLAALMLAGVRDILIISTPQDIGRFRQLFKDGKHLGLKFSYAVQKTPGGIAEAFLIGKEFIGKDSVWLILGDNIFFGRGLSSLLKESFAGNRGATIFAYQVRDPQRYGVVEFSPDGKALNIEEKPKKPKSNLAVTGLYLYDSHVCDMAEKLRPSARGELEITDLNRIYLKAGKLKVEILGRGFAWLDTGTYDSLLEASDFVQVVEKRQGLQIGCIEEIAYRMGYIDASGLERLIKSLEKTNYGEYLKSVIKEKLS
ncbi:MAG: glucose-1-phosphate thymidylyltransferase RfbA [Elusimicrobia bacterium]|nr:glucose-1-phosphate thymidylyltransferase RfbA [Elusimicrobiota bacterium]